MPTKLFTPFVILRRGRVWTIVAPDLRPGKEGKKRQHPTKFRGEEQEGKARLALAQFIEARKQKQVIEGDAVDGPMTVAKWAPLFVRGREGKGLGIADDYGSILKHHVLPHIGHLRLDKVTPDHIEEVMRIAAESGRAPRTQRHVYWTMHAMFNRAKPRLLSINPCSIQPDELPKKKDADPEWRPTAMFSREEVQLLLTSPVVPPDRRVFYAVMFLAGMRFGEISALKVRHYIPDLEPLGQLQVGTSYNTKKRKLKGTKTDAPRKMPVHPWLAQILGWWLATGWEEMMGRPPQEDDLLFPTRRGTHRSCSTGWQQLNGRTASVDRRMERKARKTRAYNCKVCGKAGHNSRFCGPRPEKTRAVLGDLQRLGLRPRRQHDTRRTFITLTLGDGASKERLRLVTHGPEGDVVDLYTEMPWAALCEEVAKLRIGPPAPQPLVAVPNASISLEPGLPSGCHGEINQPIQEVLMRPQRDSNPNRLKGRLPPTRATGSKSAAPLGEGASQSPPDDANAGQPRPLATLATLAMRQALAALEKGRMDLATDILRRAVADEADEGRAGGAS